MPRIARSGSTCRTGMSVDIARRSRHAATACATARRPGAQRADVLQLRPRVVGIGRRGRLGQQLGARVVDPVEPAELGQPGGEAVVRFEQVRHVGRCVLALIDGERTAQPVGEPVALGRADAELALQQGDQRRCAVAHEAARDLRVEQASRHASGGVREHVEILLRRVKDCQRVGLEETIERPYVDGQRVDEHQLAGPRQLQQRQLRVSTCVHDGTRCRARSAARRRAGRSPIRTRRRCRPSDTPALD